MDRGATRLIAVVVVSFPMIAIAAPPSKEDLRRAVKQLGDENFASREKAMRLLWNAGVAAEPFLKEALNSADPEVARRARTLLDRIIYRIDPGTPAEIVTLVERYRNGAAEDQIAVLREMLRIGGKAYPYLARMLDAVDGQRRRMILDQFAFDDWKALAPLIVDGQEPVVADILAHAVVAQIDSIIPHYAAFYAGSPKQLDIIRKLRAEIEKTNNSFSARLLLAVYRTTHDHDGMMWAAQRGGQPETVRLLLQERGKWSELLDKHPPAMTTGLSQITGLGQLAAYQRLAGRGAEFNETLKKIDEYAAASAPRNDNRTWYAAKAFLINEQTSRATALLLRNEHVVAAELLAAQGKYREALDVTEKSAKAERGEKYLDRTMHVLLLHRTGSFDKAKESLRALQKDMGKNTAPAWLDRQIELEAKLGLRDSALKHLQERIDQHDGAYLGAAFAHVFPGLGARSETLFRLLRSTHSRETVMQVFRRMDAVEQRRHNAGELTGALKTAAPATTWLPNQSLSYAFDNLASLVELLDLADVAQALLHHAAWQKAPTSARIALADTLANAQRWDDAAAAYRKIAESDRPSPLPYFLYGRALTKVGNAAEGRAIMDRSHRMCLGSEPARHWFYRALLERGFLEEAAKEMAARQILAPRYSYYLGQMQADAVRAAAARGDDFEAAKVMERNLLRYLTANLSLRGASAYIRATSSIHAFRARGLLKQGKRDEALREIEIAQALHGTNLELPIATVALLESKGQTEKAKQVFGAIHQTLANACRDYPDCAEAHNQIAWLSARCRRNLDDALKHAERAVALSPNTAAYVDTLAEVHFQRGDRMKAVELMKKCLKMPSNNVGFYRLQLKRFMNGEPKDEPLFEY